MTSALWLLILVMQNPDFSRAMQLVGEGRYLEAHAVIETLPDAVDRAQAEVFLRLRAGDLPGALRSAERGTEVAPDDLWLLERRASIAISLGAREAAERAVGAYAKALERAGSDQASSPLEGLGEELDRMQSAEAERRTARTRSRVTVLASLGMLLGLLAKFSRR